MIMVSSSILPHVFAYHFCDKSTRTRGLSGKESACNARAAGSISGGEDPQEKEMATHSSIFAWEIPWRVEPSGLQSIGSPRDRYNSVTEQQQRRIHRIFINFVQFHVNSATSCELQLAQLI